MRQHSTRRYWLLAAAVLLAAANAGARGDLARRKLDNGLTVILQRDDSSAVACVAAFVAAGESRTGVTGVGVRPLLQEIIGASGEQAMRQDEFAPLLEMRDADQLPPDLASILQGENPEERPHAGRVFVSGTDWEFAHVHSTVVAELLPLACRLLAQAVFQPDITEEARETALARLRMRAGMLRANPMQRIIERTYALFQEALTGSRLGAVPPVDQYAQAPDSSLEEVRGFHSRYFVPNNMCVVVASPLPHDEALRAVAEAFSAAESRPVPEAPAPPQPRAEPGAKVDSMTLLRLMGGAASLMVGAAAPSLASPDIYAAQVANAALGRPGGRLKRDRGLARALLSPDVTDEEAPVESLLLEAGTTSSRLVVHAFANPLRLESVRGIITDWFASLANSPLKEDELAQAKAYAINTYVRLHESRRDQAWLLGRYEILGVGAEFDETFVERVQAVTSDDVQRLARDSLQVTAVGVAMPETPAERTERPEEAQRQGMAPIRT
ncbi:MAG: M16 family metallopeptidase [Armatimonadota bacterium]